MLGISKIAYYLPSNKLTAQDLSKQYGFEEKFITDKLGVQQLFVSDKNEFASDLAVKAVKKIFKEDPALEDKIECLVVVTQTPDYQLPHTAAIIQNKLGLVPTLASFDISLGCSGFVYALSVISSFMKENDMKYGLLVTTETYSKYLSSQDRDTKCLFSDAACATLISENPVWIPKKFTFGTDGSRHEDLIKRSGENIRMNGPGIFEFVLRKVPKNIDLCLKKNGIDINEIDSFVFHQANRYMLDNLTRRMEIPSNKWIDAISDTGNTVSSSVPIALTKIQDIHVRRVLISGFGVGLSWASGVLEKRM